MIHRKGPATDEAGPSWQRSMKLVGTADGQ